MSFVVEIPSTFSRPTQIPVRLGNTVLTGNETIYGSLAVNGSFTVNPSDTNNDIPVVINYDSINVHTLNVEGQTTLKDVSMNDLDISGMLNVEGQTTLKDVSMNDLDISGMLNVEGQTTLKDVSMNGDLDISGMLNVEGQTTLKDVSMNNLDISGMLNVEGQTTLKDVSMNDLDIFGILNANHVDVSGTMDICGNVGIGGVASSEKLKVYGDMNVTGILSVDGSFNFREINSTTINNTILVSSQLDISNEGTGPALKVSQLGMGDTQDVAVFNAGSEGDALKIDSCGNTFVYKDITITGTITNSGLTSALNSKQPTIDTDTLISCKTITTASTPTPVSNSIGGLAIERLTSNNLRLNTPDGNILIAHSTSGGSNTLNAPTKIVMSIADQDFINIRSNGLRIGDGNAPTEALDVVGNIKGSGTLVINDVNIQTAINGKQATIQDGDLTIARTSGLQDALNGKQPNIQDGDLTIAKTSGLQEALNSKQPTINSNTDLTTNSITTTDLNVDSILTYENETLMFNTIVVMRVSNNQHIHFREIQLWVNGNNILPDSVVGSTNTANQVLGNNMALFTYYNLRTASASTTSPGPASNAINEEIEEDFGVHSGFNGQSFYIPLNITLNAYNIQSIVYYNRTLEAVSSRVEGLRIDLYNRTTDPNLTTPILSTNEITTARDVYRYDFPKIITYPTASFVGADSITNIVNDTYALKEVVLASNPVEILTDLTITGDLTLSGTLTNSGLTTALEGKQASLDTASAISIASITTTGNATIGGTLTINGETIEDMIIRLTT